MNHFVPREKMSKKARKELDQQKRTLWNVDPRPKIIESKKKYNRQKSRAELIKRQSGLFL